MDTSSERESEMAGKRKTARERLETLRGDFRSIEAQFVKEGDFDFAQKLHDYAKGMPTPPTPGASGGMLDD